MSLSKDLFNKIHTKTVGDSNYHVYIPVGHPMILFSLVDGSPLASLHTNFRKHKNDNKYCSICTELTESTMGEQRFQAVFSKENEEVTLTITNLSDDGMINFNIMKNDAKVSETDPGGLNQINELRPNESIVIESDFTNSNKTIILRKNKKSDGSTTTLATEITSKKENQVGNYLYLNVSPQTNNKKLCEKFQNTLWKPADFFIKSDNLVMKSATRGATRGARRVVEEYAEEESGGFGDLFGYSAGGIIEESGEVGTLGYQDVYESAVSLSSTNRYPFLNSGEKKDCKSTNDRKKKGEEKEIYDDSVGNLFETDFGSMYKSEVANIDHGEKVNVLSQTTDNVYSHDLCSRKCVLGLSVFDNLKVRDKQANSIVIKEASEFIDKLSSDKLKELLNEMSKIYKSDECVLCMDEKPNRVFYKCGHMCVHKECCDKKLDNCPMCRATIYCEIDL